MGIMVVSSFFTLTPSATLLASSPALPPVPSMPSVSLAPHPFSRLGSNSVSANPKSPSACSAISPYVLKQRSALIAKASAEGSTSDGPVDSEEENIPVQNLPLESKLQLKLEQKMRMKLAKKIRLRRKKLVMKRHLRKKGRWPPSKMKKNKNV